MFEILNRTGEIAIQDIAVYTILFLCVVWGIRKITLELLPKKGCQGCSGPDEMKPGEDQKRF
jgi:hypothetical protein